MAGLFGVLGVSSQALLVTQAGIRTVSHNISNVNTPGFSRQRQILQAGPAIPNPAGNLGSGVRQVTIARVTDGFIQDQLVKQAASQGSTEMQTTALQLVEQVLNEQGGEGVLAALSSFYTGFAELAASETPGQSVERQGLVAAANALINTLGQADSQLRDIMTSNDQAIGQTLTDINSITQRIQGLNVEIARQGTVAPANDLEDQRDLLVRELSRKVDIVTYGQGDSSIVVALSNGLPLVEGISARTLVTQADPTNLFNPTFSNVMYSDGSSLVDVTSLIGGGELGGLLAARDTILPASIRSLDTLAYNAAVTVNTVHSAGVGLNSTVGNFFVAPAAVENAARDLALHANIIASTDAIAAGLTTAAGDIRNAQALSALRDTASTLFLPGDPPGPATGPSRTLLDYTASVTADIGQQTRTMEQSNLQQERILLTLENRRDEISGVSLDEEVTNLIRLQAAFQANSRVITTVDRLIQDVLRML